MRQLAPVELADWLQDAGRTPPAVLDVREPWEVALCAIAGSRTIPMSQIVQRIDELDPQQDLVVVCHHGMRSLQVAMYLQRCGFDRVCNLQGGIDAWARDVEPAMARY